MKRQWRARRQVLPQPDGQRRWDWAYQLLLDWTAPREATGSIQLTVESPTVPALLSTQEVEQDASGHVCACLDAAAGARGQH